jgi:nicotinate-nucleotide pyrophosphorylase (carboxylating)
MTPNWSEVEVRAANALITLAFAEDLEERGDVTTRAVIPPDLHGTAELIARTEGVVAGLPILPLVFSRLDPRVRIEERVADAQTIASRQVLAVLSGPYRALLTGERTALNFLQRLSGVATQTHRYLKALHGLPCLLLDTRKTTPGWRALEKYAVRCGGGHNHRRGLYDAILIKDNHLAALGSRAGAIARAVAAARAQGYGLAVEIEVGSLLELHEALAAGPDAVLLDNMSADLLREAVAMRKRLAPKVRLEASGGITLANLRAVAETGVDYVSVGALTHSAVALDLAIDFQIGSPEKV